MQMFAANGLAVIVIGRLIAGFGVGFVSAIIILCESAFLRRLDPAEHRIDSLCFPLQTCPKFALARSVERSFPDTNSASPLVSCLPRSSSTSPKTEKTPVLTEFPSESKLVSLSFLAPRSFESRY